MQSVNIEHYTLSSIIRRLMHTTALLVVLTRLALLLCMSVEAIMHCRMQHLHHKMA